MIRTKEPPRRAAELRIQNPEFKIKGFSAAVIRKAYKGIVLLPALFFLLIFFPGCLPAKKQMLTGEDTVKVNNEPVKISIAAVGDFLMHDPLFKSSLDPGTGKYDFRDIFAECRHYLSSPDFTMANLETRLAGPAPGYSGYPLFNTPAELAENMKELGIDLVTTANNHSMDMGRQGVITTLDNLDRAGLHHVGTYRNPRERERPAVFDVRGVRVGVINYTQDTNGIPVPSDVAYMVNLINRDSIIKEIENLKAAGCDFLIAYMHFGTEYQRHPNEFQRTLARELFDAGADVVMGSHPHVIQPLEWQRALRRDGEKGVLAAYSLGNFVSNQHWRYSDCGIILNLEVVKNGGEGAYLAGASYIPVWVDTYIREGGKKYRVLPVHKAILDFESKRDPLLTESDYRQLKQAWQDTLELMGPGFPPGIHTP